ncbi:uncharacterized protein LOC100678809 isoform X1 [Nasonia vitripennis]|uniref:TBC1 domain family member 30 n=1 Tax=Nasonia vitripennis TaxID=7425 RepID=A0A7M7IYA1_NASVI|nr:uncharacterized protein LOC100678809 isoform X1 [Nasonia vitripennis]XP_016845650.1 uncharacterized protein LOC100678809 isoform X1 [Nasonia vitripennis]XP_031785889.1 uncharacterized protein LOC100678809 isoform X1 [Nasonia vitripennis]
MKCQVLPAAELSYCVKCVAVESERVFGDVVVTRRSSAAELPAAYQRSRQNLVQQYLEGPNFLELNRRRPMRRQSAAVAEEGKRDSELKLVARSTRSKSLNLQGTWLGPDLTEHDRTLKTYPAAPLPPQYPATKEIVVSSLVDQLLVDIYGPAAASLCGSEWRTRSESESTNSSWKSRQHQRPYLQRTRLELKSKGELRVVLGTLRDHVSHTGSLLVRQLRRRDYLLARREKLYNVITAHLQAHSSKRSEDTRMKFSLTPQPGESGFIQWLDAMKMVAKLQGGIPAEFRRKLWLTLAERHLEQRGVDWKQAEKLCFNEWSNPDDEELGIQIVKDLHRTGCSLFCGAAGRDNQAVLRRVLLGFARWNKSVGYCQGLNVLAALILQVVDRDEAAAVKVMIYLIEGVLPEGYFADSLRGLSIDMAVFRDLLRMRLPRLSRHLESLQNDAKDKATVLSGSSYEPPLTNVFTMQWFLTLFCHCLPQDAVLRVWDLIFLEGDDVLLRTALAIWEGLSDRIMTVTSADEFYSIMGVLTREMLEFTDTNHLVKTIVSMGPLNGVTSLREKHRFNITPWARRLSDDDDSDTEDDERLAVAAAAAIFAMPRMKKSDRNSSSTNALSVQPANDRERLALDISTLKQHYAKLRERQRQAHIILSAACARQSAVPTPSTSLAMNHLLVGKSALVSGKNRTIVPAARAKTITVMHPSPRTPVRKERQQQGVTIHWKDMKKRKDEREVPESAAAEAALAVAASAESEVDGASSRSVAPAAEGMTTAAVVASTRRASLGSSGGAAAFDSDSDSTSTELCDEPDRLSDVDSEELTSTSECYVMASADEDGTAPATAAGATKAAEKSVASTSDHLKVSREETSIAEITDQIRRLSADDADFKTSLNSALSLDDKKTTTSAAFLDIGRPNEEKSKPTILEPCDVGVNKSSLLSSFDINDKLTQFETNRSFDDNSTVLTSCNMPANLEDARTKDETDTSATLSADEFLASSANRVGIDTTNLLADRSSADVDVSVPIVARGDGDGGLKKTSYVIGHLPIAPMNFETRKAVSRIASSPEVLVSRDEVGVSLRDRLARDNFASSLDASIINPDTKFSSFKIQLEDKRSPKTPESTKSFSSGETMGPDSITSSLAVSPKTPMRSDSRDFVLSDKSVASSASSDSKTLTMRSVESEAAKKPCETPGDKSVTPSTDSLVQLKSTEPPCSSTESFCSPSKLKSSERSFSSDLQSPVSANSIKFTANYSYKLDDDLQKPSTEIGPVTSPFYPILYPNQKTPSPYSKDKSRTNRDGIGIDEFRDVQELHENIYIESKTPTNAFDVSQISTSEENISIKLSSDNDSFKGSLRKLYSYEPEEESAVVNDGISDKDKGRTSAFELYHKNKLDDELQETDMLSPLPHGQFETRNDVFERTRGKSLDGKLDTLEITGKSHERSSSSLEKRFPDMLLSPSMEDFANSVKKRSSDVLEDLRHLEAKTTDGEIDPSMLTRKTSFIWEDLKSLEARRQDTFSDSASGFSRQRIDVPGISISSEGRKTYIVEPKINIDENSDSILKCVTYKSSNGINHDDDDDGSESKLGVWTKVKPRKRNDSGRRSSDRALKIIQENSAILQKILTCQARKRLPDLEEISKEITISPINEEISKIFSPILEKMGLNEHEINEELARINFKDLDRNTTTTTASEFDAKINDELSKLSLIGDNEEVAYLPDVDDISSDYLVARDAFIDRQINEELSKLLANYEQESPMTLQKGSSSLNASDDLSTCSTNVYSYKSSNDSLDMKSDHSSKDPVHSLTYPEKPIPYVPRNNYTAPRDISAKSDVDIYRELEKLDQISYAQALPAVSAEVVHPEIIQPSIPYISDVIRSPKIDYSSIVIEKQPTYDISPLKSPYDSPYSSTILQPSYDYKSRISPRKTPSNPYSVRSYDTKSTLDTGFENSTFELTAKTAIVPTTLNYEYGPKKHILSKEHLEFRVKYDQEGELMGPAKPATRDISLKLSPFQTDIVELDKGASYYSNKTAITPTNKYASNKDDKVSMNLALEHSAYEPTYQRRKYDNVSPADKYPAYSTNYDVPRQPYKVTTLEPESSEIFTYLTNSTVTSSSRHRDTYALSPHYQPSDYTKPVASSYTTVSPSFDNSLTSATSVPKLKNTYADVTPTDTMSYKKTTLVLGNVGETKQVGNTDMKCTFDGSPSPKSLGFSPFPVRNAQRKPKELGLKLGLYSPTNSAQSKRS